MPDGDIRDLDEGYASSDHFSSNDDSDVDENRFILKTPIFSKTDLDKVDLVLGMRFPTKADFGDAIKEYSIQKGKSIKFKRNSSEKMYLYCSNSKDCVWYMYAKKLPDEPTIQIRTFIDKHTCSRVFVNTSVKPRYIAKKFLEMIRMNPTWRVTDFRVYVAKKLTAEVSLSKAYRAFKIAKKAIEGSSAEQYELLWDYCNEMRRSNPGSTVVMKVKKNGGTMRECVFRSLYICWASLKRGFLEGCRPLVGIDGTHLTGPHKGVLLTAVAIDPNNCMYPFAYAVVGVENYRTWKWFIKLLSKDLDIVKSEDYTFMSDKQKGLIKAMEEILPGVEHRFCVWHLYNNFKLLHKGVALKNLLWKAARSTTKSQFIAAPDEMKEIDESAYDWLSSKPGENWSKSHFSTHPKCDLLLNNLCECFNAAIKKARGKPILSMLEDIMLYLMDLVMKKKVAIEKVQTETKLCPKIHNKLDARALRSHEWLVAFNGCSGFEVSGPYGDRFEVDLKRMTCGCKSWQLIGIPCPHAITCMNFMHYDVESYVHLCYSKEVYRKTYANLMMHMNGRYLWMKSGKKKVMPPEVRVAPGRPKKARNKAPDEPKDSHKTKMSRKWIIMKCKLCRKEGHNQRTCGKPEKQKKKAKKSNETQQPQHLVDESGSEEGVDDFGERNLERHTENGEGIGDGEREREQMEAGGEGIVDRQREREQMEASGEGIGDGERERDGEEIADDEDNGGGYDDVFGDTVVSQIDTQNPTQLSGVTQVQNDVELVQCPMREETPEQEVTPMREETPEREEQHVEIPVRKQPVRRKSSRLMFSPNKNSPTVISLVDLTDEGTNDGLLHAGIMKKRERPNNLPKGQFYIKGKLFVTKEALEASIRHDKLQAKKHKN